MKLASIKHQQSTRKMFYQWHHNVFPKSTHKSIVEGAAKNDVESRLKLVTLNKMAK